MPDLKSISGISSVKAAAKSFIPKAKAFTVKTSKVTLKTAGDAAGAFSKAAGGVSNLPKRVAGAVRRFDGTVSSGTAANAAAGKQVVQLNATSVRLSARFVREMLLRQTRRLTGYIGASAGARAVQKISTYAVKKLIMLTAQLSLPVLCLFLTVILMTGFFGYSNTETTFGGIISMPFVYTDIGVNDEYGIRYHPIYEEYSLHTGIDFATPHHCDILAAQSGRVIMSMEATNGYGNMIMIRHDVNGMIFYTLYAHLSQRLVRSGDYVFMGQKIGVEGGSEEDPGHGTSTGHHLHFEYRNADGNSEDPRIYLNYWQHML